MCVSVKDEGKMAVACVDVREVSSGRAVAGPSSRAPCAARSDAGRGGAGRCGAARGCAGRDGPMITLYHLSAWAAWRSTLLRPRPLIAEVLDPRNLPSTRHAILSTHPRYEESAREALVEMQPFPVKPN